MDVNDQILAVEQALARLAKQQQQEQAMQEVLPLRFSQNMQAFAHYMPEIYEFFKDYNPNRGFRFFCNENGIPNLLWLDEQVAMYGDDPYKDAQNQIVSVIDSASLECINLVIQPHFSEQIHIEYNNAISTLRDPAKLSGLKLSQVLVKEIPLALMYGVGLGYQLSYLYQSLTVKNLFAFEPDLDLFYASLFCFDWYALLSYMEQSSLTLHLFLGVDESQLISDMITALHRKGAFWSSAYFSFCHYPSAILSTIEAKVAHEFYLLRSGWGFFDDNIFALAHSHDHLKNQQHFLKQKIDSAIYHDYPVFVIGNGPSLDESLDFIVKHQSHAILIACGTAISALYKAGIQPDIYVAVERTKSSADFLSLLDAEEYLRDILFLTVDVIHPECRQFFTNTGFAFKGNETMYQLLTIKFPELALQYCALNYTNPFVGNLGVNYAAILGFRDIYLIGIDNGYKQADKHHSSLSLYYNEKKQAKYQENISDGFLIPANFGGKVHSNHIFGLAIHNIEQVIQTSVTSQFYNLSDGALINGAKPTGYHEINFKSRQPIDKQKFKNQLYQHCFVPLITSYIDFDSAMAGELFNSRVDKMIADWSSVDKNYSTILSLMQRQYDEWLALLLTEHRHLYLVLVGSLNYFYANIITLLLAIDGDNDDCGLVKIEQAIAILIAFLQEAKHRYGNVLERIDTEYFHGLDVFKP